MHRHSNMTSLLIPMLHLYFRYTTTSLCANMRFYARCIYLQQDREVYLREVFERPTVPWKPNSLNMWKEQFSIWRCCRRYGGASQIVWVSAALLVRSPDLWKIQTINLPSHFLQSIAATIRIYFDARLCQTSSAEARHPYDYLIASQLHSGVRCHLRSGLVICSSVGWSLGLTGYQNSRPVVGETGVFYSWVSKTQRMT